MIFTFTVKWSINLFHLQFALLQSHDLDTDVTKEKVLAVDDKNVMISFFVGKERKIGARRDTNSIRWALLKPNTFPFPCYSSQKRSKGIKIYRSQASKYLLKVLLHENPSFKYLSELSNHSILAVKSFRDGCNFCYNLQSRDGGTIKESTMLDLFYYLSIKYIDHNSLFISYN